MKWSNLERIPKIPLRLAVRNPGLVIQKAKLMLGWLEIRLYDVLVCINRRITGRE